VAPCGTEFCHNRFYTAAANARGYSAIVTEAS
jgi:hypothetical protein